MKRSAYLRQFLSDLKAKMDVLAKKTEDEDRDFNEDEAAEHGRLEAEAKAALAELDELEATEKKRAERRAVAAGIGARLTDAPQPD